MLFLEKAQYFLSFSNSLPTLSPKKDIARKPCNCTVTLVNKVQLANPAPNLTKFESHDMHLSESRKVQATPGAPQLGPAVQYSTVMCIAGKML